MLRDVLVSWRGTAYEPIKPIGDGGTSDVHMVLATSGATKGIFFAAKVFQKIEDKKRLTNFMREVHFLRSVDHPAIMSIEDEGQLSDGRPFVIMQLQSSTLRKCSSSLSILDKSTCGMNLLSALHYLSRQDPPVVHRDVKPTNIFATGATFILGDFGLVTLFDGASHGVGTRPTIPEMARHYPTPELVLAYHTGRAAPPASDVFQLGLVLAELFTGNNPASWDGKSARVVLAPLSEYRDSLGEKLSSIIADMLIERTQERPTAARLLQRWQECHLATMKRERDQKSQLRPPGAKSADPHIDG
jgi:serine/threonine protein kinase